MADYEPHKHRFLACVRILQSSGSSPAAIEEANRYLSNFNSVDRYWRVCISVLVDYNTASTTRRSDASEGGYGTDSDLNFCKYVEFISIKLLSNAINNDDMLSACDVSEYNALTDLLMEMLYSTTSIGGCNGHLPHNYTIPVNTKQLCLCLVSIVIWSIHNNNTKYATERILLRILSVASSSLTPALVSLYIFEELPLQFCKLTARSSSSSSRVSDPDAFLTVISTMKEYIWSAFVAAASHVINHCSDHPGLISVDNSALNTHLLLLRASLACLVTWGSSCLHIRGACGDSSAQSWSTVVDITLEEARGRCLLHTIQKLTEGLFIAASPSIRAIYSDDNTLFLASEVASSAMDLLVDALSSCKTPPAPAATTASTKEACNEAYFALQAFIVTLRLCDGLAGGLAVMRSQLRMRIDSLLQLRESLSVRAGTLSNFSGEGDFSLSVSLVSLLACLAQNHSPVLLAGAYADARSRCYELGAANGTTAPDCELLLTSSLVLCLCLPDLSAAVQVIEVYTYITDVVSSPASISALVEPTVAALLMRSMYPSTISQGEVKAFEMSQGAFGTGRRKGAGREAELDGFALDTLQSLQEYRREASHLLQRVCVAWDRDGVSGAMLVDDCAALFSQAGALRGYGECADPASKDGLQRLAHALEAYLLVILNIMETYDEGGGDSKDECECDCEDRTSSCGPASSSGTAALGGWLALLTHISLSLEPCYEALSQHFPVVLNRFLALWASAPLMVRRALNCDTATKQPQHTVERLLSSTLLIAVNTLPCPYNNNKATKAIGSIASHLRKYLHFCAVGVCQHFMAALPSLPSEGLRQSDVRDVFSSLGTLIMSIPHKETMLLIASQVFTSTSERLLRDCEGVYGRWTDVAGDSMSRLDGLLKGLGGYNHHRSNVLRDSIPAVTLSMLRLLEQQVAFYRGSTDDYTVHSTATFTSLVLKSVSRLVDTYCLGLTQLEEVMLCMGRVADCCSTEALGGVPPALAAVVRAMSEEPAMTAAMADRACTIIWKCLQRAALSCKNDGSGSGSGSGSSEMNIGGVVDLSEAVAELPCECLRLVRQCCLAAPQVLLMQAGAVTRGYLDLLVAAITISGSRCSASFMRVASASLSAIGEKAVFASGDSSVASVACEHMQSSSFALLRLLLLDGVFGKDMRVARVYAELNEHLMTLVQCTGGAALAASVLQAVCEELVPSVMQRAPTLTHTGRDGVAVHMTAPEFVRVVYSSLQRQMVLDRGGAKRAFMALAFAAQGGDYSSARNYNTFDYDLINPVLF